MSDIAVCSHCGAYTVPVGNFRYAVCSQGLAGNCEANYLVDNPGGRVCLMEAARQTYPHAAYDRHLRKWILNGLPVSMGCSFNMLSMLEWRDIECQQSLAFFGSYGLREVG